MPGQRLLIVDDEPLLLELLKRYLERSGYVVRMALDPATALTLFELDPDAVDLVITDLTFEDINGEEMLARMRARRPDLRAVIASGYPHEPKLERVGFLQKPFLPKMLAAAIEEQLR